MPMPVRRRRPHAGEPPSLRIAMLAPPWIPIPAPGYGGIETVVQQLCEQLVADGHDVTLFAAPGTRSAARVKSILPRAHPLAIGQALYEAGHVGAALDAIDQAARDGRPFDVLHDHSGFTALAVADRIATPMVHTVHGAFTRDVAEFYRLHGHKARLVAISESQRDSAPEGVAICSVVPNPVAVGELSPAPAPARGRHLLCLGRLDEAKGPHRAIEAARLAGRPLLLAGPVQRGQERFFAEHVAPHVDGEAVTYVGEIGGVRKRRALAEAAALLMPIRWREPFGMVMVEALASGTPVIAFPEGAATEIVVDGVNGFLVDDEQAMAAAVGRLDEIDPAACRAGVQQRYDVRRVVHRYEWVYRQAIRRPIPAPGSSPERPVLEPGALLARR